jgi:hypothetical protein
MKTIIVLDFSTGLVHVCNYDDTTYDYDDVDEYLDIDPDGIGWQASNCQAMTVANYMLIDHRI